jgi:predicted dehydrogenase
MSSQDLRCAVIGVGRMGRHHARIYAQTQGAELVGVLDHDMERATQITQEWGGKVFEDIAALIESGVDAVTIATPTIYHRQVAEPLLAAGVACMIEKPLAATAGEAQAIADAAEAGGAVLQVGHVVRFDPVMLAIRELQGLTPRFIEMVRISPMTFRSVDVGVVLDMMIHDLDLLMMLVGKEPEEVHANAVGVMGEAEDVCNARLVFPAGDDGIRCVANITASRLAMKTERKLRIISEEMYVSADFVQRSGTVVRRTANQSQLDEIKTQLASGEDLSSVDYLELVDVDQLEVLDGEPLKRQSDAFLSAVRNGDRPEVDAQAGSAAVRTAERIVAAAKAEMPAGHPASI